MPPISLPIYERESLDNSILGTLSRCPRLCFYNYVLNRAGRGENFPINFGSAFHLFMETLENIFLSHPEYVEDEAGRTILYETSKAVALKDWIDPPLEDTKSYLDEGRLVKTFNEAFGRWLNEKKTGSYVSVGTESSFDLPLPSGRRFCGKLDRVIKWNGRVWILDYKTSSRKDKDLKKTFNPAHQFTGYSWALLRTSGKMPEGVIVDFIHNIKTKGPDFYPTFASRNMNDIEHWLEWVEDKWDEWERRNETGIWPMNTTACNDYGGCFFKEACNTGNWSSINDWLIAHTVESNWSPLDAADEKGLPG